jgi:hypothetical protein
MITDDELERLRMDVTALRAMVAAMQTQLSQSASTRLPTQGAMQVIISSLLRLGILSYLLL